MGMNPIANAVNDWTCPAFLRSFRLFVQLGQRTITHDKTAVFIGQPQFQAGLPVHDRKSSFRSFAWRRR